MRAVAGVGNGLNRDPRVAEQVGALPSGVKGLTQASYLVIRTPVYTGFLAYQ